jgi:hypothetical protein
VTVAVGLVGVALSVQACGQATAGGASAPSGDRAAKAEGRIAKSFFGMHAQNLASAFPKTKAGAVDLTTNGVYWPDLETTAGHFDFTKLDSLVATVRSHGARPLLVLGETPAFHSTKPHADNVRATVPRSAAWKTYVKKVVNRYDTTIDYEIWPEPNIVENWAGSPRQLAGLVASAAKIIHKRAPQAVVVSPAFVIRVGFERKYMDSFFASKVGGKPVGHFVDAVGVDPYPLEKGTPEDSFTLLRKAQAILRQHKVDAPVWNVEINYGVVGSHAPSHAHWGARKQESYLVRNYVLDAGAGVARVYWLGWFPFSAGAIQLVKPDGVTPTPAATSLSVVQKWLTGERASACSRAKQTHIWSCKLVSKGHASWVYWTAKGKAHVKTPEGARHVEQVTGASTSTHQGKRLTVTTSPIWVHR